jgi:predicted transcriptional regulator
MVEALIAVGIFTYVAGMIGLVYWATNRWRASHAATQYKFSDAEVFKLMARANHFLTEKQLAAASPLTEKEAKARLMHLSIQRVLRRFYDGTGQASVYQLKEEVPLINSLPANIHNLSEKDIIDVVLMHVDDYQVTIAELVVIFGIDIYEARKLITQLRKHGSVTTLRKGFGYVYVVKHPIGLKTPNLRTTPRKKDLGKIAIPDQKRIKIPDSDIIQLAIENKGKLTPTLLCLKKKIPINEAKIILEQLYEQGAFIMDLDEQNFIMEYHLRDKSLL